MPSKEVSLPFQVCASATMSGTSVFTSSATSIIYRDSLAYQFNWTGNPTGTFQIQGSVDYNPGLPQSAGTFNSGNWNPVTITPTPTAASGSATYLVNMNQLAFSYARFQYTNASGSGVLGAWTCGKSLG